MSIWRTLENKIEEFCPVISADDRFSPPLLRRVAQVGRRMRVSSVIVNRCTATIPGPLVLYFISSLLLSRDSICDQQRHQVHRYLKHPQQKDVGKGSQIALGEVVDNCKQDWIP